MEFSVDPTHGPTRDCASLHGNLNKSEWRFAGPIADVHGETWLRFPALNEPSGIPTSGRLAAAADRMRIDAATAEVLRRFDAAGVDCVLLKGPALTSWLYAEGARRSYLDTDLLVRPGHEATAESALRSLGFERRWDQSTLPDWWQEHGSDWFRPGDGVVVDLHRSLPGVGADAELVWSTLAATTDTLTVAGYDVQTLSVPGRALHVSLHAIQHGADWGKGRGDLERALEVADDPTWREAAALATRIEGIDAFAAGLRMLPRGEELADRMGLPAAVSVDVALRASAPPPVALGFEQLARAHGLRARLGIGMRKLFPPREFLAHWDPRARESRGRFLLARVKRPMWVLASAPRGFRAWWRARRQVRGG